MLINHLLDWLGHQKMPTAFIFNSHLSVKNLIYRAVGHFSRSPIVQVVAFWLLFDVVLIVPPATWFSRSAAPFEDMAVVEKAV